jgi:hypothetical protein
MELSHGKLSARSANLSGWNRENVITQTVSQAYLPELDCTFPIHCSSKLSLCQDFSLHANDIDFASEKLGEKFDSSNPVIAIHRTTPD